MTQPDKYVPPESSNYDGLAAFAGKTQADWEAENRALMEARFGDALAGVIILLEQIPIIGDIIEILTGVEDGDLNDLGTAANKFKNFLGSQWGGLLQAVEQGLDDAGRALGGVGEMIGAAGTALGGAVIGTAAALGEAFAGLVQGVQQSWDAFWNGIFGTNQSGKTPSDVQVAAGTAVSNTNTAATNAGQALGEIGQMILAVPATIVGAVVTTAAHVGEAIAGAIKGVQDTWTGFWNGVFGIPNVSGELRQAEDMYLAANSLLQRALNALANANTAVAVNYETASKGAAVLYSLRGGYTVDTITASGTWTKPVGLAEVFVALFAAGAKGGDGAVSTPQIGQGGTGGTSGRVIAAQLDPRSIASEVSCVIGDGTSITPGATSFGSIISTADAFESYVSTPLGLMQTFAQASAGGRGSNANGIRQTALSALTYAESGKTTRFGLTGGAGGLNYTVANRSGASGGSGKSGLDFGLSKTGGSGGGGGGGGANVNDATGTVYGDGGNGGAGGAPGGGGGGGGGAGLSQTAGVGGNGGNGLILIIYKLASDVLPL